MSIQRRLWYAGRPLVWRWRLGYWDWDAIRVAASFALTGRAPRAAKRQGGKRGA
jgi:hypothetical protein